MKDFLPVDVTGAFLARKGPHDYSLLAIADTGFKLDGVRQVIPRGTKTAVLPDGSRLKGDMFDAYTGSTYFLPHSESNTSR